MRTIVNSNNYGDIGTAVFYRWHKYIPNNIQESDKEELIESCKSDKVQFKGSRQYTSLRDFSEYNFSYDIKKFKFNDTFFINLLDDSSLSLVGKDLDDLERVSDVLFPTITEDSSYEYNETFFGSSLISNQTLIVLNADGNDGNREGHWKIELYEEGVESNNDVYGGFIEVELLENLGIEITNSPIITIYLGPESNVSNNSSDMYYSYDPMLTEKNSNDRLGSSEYRKLMEEINMYKVAWILLALDDSSMSSINLSYRSWIDNINPNRNMKDYIIRNDEYYSTKNNLLTVEKLNEESDILIDKNSGTIVGNEKITTLPPILRGKLAKISNDNSYSPYIKYSLGDEVTFGVSESNRPLYWKSLCENNIGNFPTLSSTWILSNYINSIFTSRISIISSPVNGGYTDPGKSITVSQNTAPKSFMIYCSIGYAINTETPVSSTNNIPLVTGEYELSNNNRLTILNWDKLRSSGRLIFNFILIGCSITLNAIDLGGYVIDYENWKTSTGLDEPNFELSKLLVNDEEQPLLDNFTGELTLDPNSKITLIFPELNKYSISKVISNYVRIDQTGTKEIIPEVNENGESIITDTVDYNNTTYSLELVEKTLTITMIDSEDFEISQAIGRVIYGDDYSVSFYSDTITLNQVIISSRNDSLTLTVADINRDNITFGDSTIEFTVEDNIYTISMSNVTVSSQISLN